MEWINIQDKKPQDGKYYLICSKDGWVGIQRYANNSWCATEFPDVIIDNIVYDVANNDITHYANLDDIIRPNQPERSKREDILCCCMLCDCGSTPHDIDCRCHKNDAVL